MIRQILAFLTAVAVLGIAQYLTATAWAAFAILLLMSAVVHPRATAAFLASLGLLAMALRAPAAMAAALAAVGVSSVVAGHVVGRRRSSAEHRLSPSQMRLPGLQPDKK